MSKTKRRMTKRHEPHDEKLHAALAEIGRGGGI